MIIAFASIDAAAEALEAFRPDVVISISSPGRPVGELDDRPHLLLSFNDIERMPFHGHMRVLPSRRHVEAFVEFLDNHRPDRLLVHCRAGLSRSPAFAIAAAVMAGRDPAAACAEVRRLVPCTQPNRLLLSLVTDQIGVDVISPALDVFTYTRSPTAAPDGERAGLCELFGASQ